MGIQISICTRKVLAILKLYFITIETLQTFKDTNSRLGLTKYSDLYEIVHPSLTRPHFFVFAHWSVMWERSIILINLHSNAFTDKEKVCLPPN